MRPHRTSHASGAPRGLDALTRWVLAHKRVVVSFWVVMALAGFFAATRVPDALRTDFSMPSSESARANEEVTARFGGGGQSPPLVAVVQLPAGTDARAPGVGADLRALEGDLARELPGSRVASFGSTADPALLSDDARTTFLLIHPRAPAAGGDPGALDPAQLAAAERVTGASRVGGVPVMLTGQELLAEAEQEGGGDSGVLNETLVAGVAALAVLAFVFASALALVPLVMAVVAIPTTMLALWGLASLTQVSFIVLFLVALVGLGIAIDYALIVVMRWREERDGGAEGEEAVRIAVRTAGRAVLFSGLTVAIGLMAAVTLPVPFLRSMGYGGLLIPSVSVAVALTLLPVVLATLGPRADRRRLRRTERAERHWAAWARLVVRRPWPALVVGAGVLVALCLMATGMLLGEPEARSLGGSGEPARALVALEGSGLGAGPLAPIEVLAPEEAAGVTAASLREVEGVRGAVAPAGWTGEGRAVLNVLPAVDTNSAAGRATVGAVRDALASRDGVAVGGQTAQVVDFVDDVYGAFPLMLGLISLVTFVLLARAFRSLLLPLKAIVLNLLSVFATWGVMVLVWQEGVGSDLLFGADPTGSIVFWAPLMVFALLFGLSMDYEVFMLARMREEYERTGSTGEAVVRGVARTGRLVTSAALIVFFAFASLGTTGPVDVKILATGLAGGILLDALVVRALLVPALVSLLGRWNWWLPAWPARLLRVKPSLPDRLAPREEGA